jgi:hypothetical protein
MYAEEQNLISLKEAAEISGYSSDYVGQLIRGGKIYGKQVYTNIAWMTTIQAVLDYKNGLNKKNKTKVDHQISLSEYFVSKKRLLKIELNILKLFFQTFKSALPLMIIIIVSFLLLNVSLFIYLFGNHVTNHNNSYNQRQQDAALTF